MIISFMGNAFVEGKDDLTKSKSSGNQLVRLEEIKSSRYTLIVIPCEVGRNIYQYVKASRK